jgi:chromate transporter
MRPEKFATGGGHDAAKKGYGAAVIDDHTPTPPHALFSWARLGTIALVGLVLWGGVMTALITTYGWEGTLTQMGWFFTKAALLTFGGAYAVLPYVYQGAVDLYGWISATQMIDGLALGETTPGPLIMVVAFVGFVGGWIKEIFGPDSLFLAGAIAACVVTYFTFLFSFLFIFAGGPLVESTHGDIKFTAPLMGITAAVVGVILNLAVFFAWHVLWPEANEAAPFSGRFEWVTLVIGVAAFIALFRFKRDVMVVLAACGVAGLAWQFSKPMFGG